MNIKKIAYYPFPACFIYSSNNSYNYKIVLIYTNIEKIYIITHLKYERIGICVQDFDRYCKYQKKYILCLQSKE